VTIGDVVVDDGRRNIRAQDRRVGYVPQDGALFPHLTVVGNVGFGVPRAERRRVGELIELVGLGALERRYPHQLSGGQQQRVALARALAVRPQVVLMDEPFSSLDATLREGVRRDVARVLAETGATTVLVTHDQDEALSMADQVAVLRSGRIVARGDPRTLYREPPDQVAATSIGEVNLVPARIRGDVAISALGEIPLAALNGAHQVDQGLLLVRPEQLVVHEPSEDGLPLATVVDIEFHGHDALVQLRIQGADGLSVEARVPGDQALTPGQVVAIGVQGTGRLL
jgi:iron(III) transport system ATP-binding protein